MYLLLRIFLQKKVLLVHRRALQTTKSSVHVLIKYTLQNSKNIEPLPQVQMTLV